MRIFYKTSLFLYEVIEDTPTPIIICWRATVFTFSKPASKATLKLMINYVTEGELVEPKDKRAALEQRQVSPSDSRGLGFNWVELSKLEKRGSTLVHPEERMEVWNLQAYEKVNLRLGYTEFLKNASAFGEDKRYRKHLGHPSITFWEWLTR